MLLSQFKIANVRFMVFLFLLSCTVVKTNLRKQPLSDRAIKQIDELERFDHRFIVMPGQVVLLYFPYYGPFKSEALMCNGNKTPFFVSPDDHVAMSYVARSYFDNADDFVCDFKFIDDISETYTEMVSAIKSIEAQNYHYPQEILRVPIHKVILSKKDSLRVAHEQKILDDLFEKSAATLLFDQPFTPPLTSKITSIFGTKRVFNSVVQTEHLGTDFRAAIGTKITAANQGMVVFAGDLFFGGNTVIVDHGLSIFTSYSHLAEIHCQIGQRVSRNDILGYSGMTGRVNGPHLHWGVKINGHWVDGNSLIKASQHNFPNQSTEK